MPRSMCTRLFAYHLLLALLTLLALTGAARADSVAPVLLDTGWKFLAGDPPDAQAPAFNAAAWRTVGLPHDWSIEGKVDRNNPMGGAGGFFPAGVGWYRRALQIPAEWKDKKISVEFEGVYMNADVWLNGRHLAFHPYGYTSFYVDLTPAVQTGENLLAVRVDNSKQVNSRWYSGSGIYRDVRLHVCEPVHFAPYGLGVSTPELSESRAKVAFTATVVNDTAATRTVALQGSLLDPAGAKAGQASATATVGAGASKELSGEMTVEKPQAWSPEAPRLYRLAVALSGDGARETIETECGLRTIAVSAAKGFQLNGKTIKLDGGCVHHDNGSLGAAAFERAEIRRVELLKAAGFNAIRTSHNPPSPAFLRACDRLGMLVLDEAFDCWAQGKNRNDYSLSFKEWWQRDIASLVLRDRNHPCVVLWSIGNEIPERYDPAGIETEKKLVAEVKRLDPTRPVTEAICPPWGARGRQPAERDASFAPLDVAGYNYMVGDYRNDHQRIPGRVIMGTESYPNQAFMNWAAVSDNPYVIGDFVWTALDYLGESGIGRWILQGEREIGHGNNSIFPWHGAVCGDVDLTGVRRGISHYRNILWDRGEKLYAAVREPAPEGRRIRLTGWASTPDLESWTWPGREGKPLEIDVYSRYDAVRLYLNDKLVGEKPTTRAQQFKALFSIPYAPGQLKAVGVSGGKEGEACLLETAGEPAKLRLTPDRAAINAQGGDLSFITVEAIDKAGRVQPNATQKIRFEIRGAGTIRGLDNGDMTDETPYQGAERKLVHGRALVVIRPTGAPGGTATLIAHAEGLPDASVEVQIGQGHPMMLGAARAAR